MAKKLSFAPILRATLPLSGSFTSSIIILDPNGIVQSFTIIAKAIRFRVFLAWKQNYLREPPKSVSAFLSPKTI